MDNVGKEETCFTKLEDGKGMEDILGKEDL